MCISVFKHVCIYTYTHTYVYYLCINMCTNISYLGTYACACYILKTHEQK